MICRPGAVNCPARPRAKHRLAARHVCPEEFCVRILLFLSLFGQVFPSFFIANIASPALLLYEQKEANRLEKSSAVVSLLLTGHTSVF